MHGDSLAPISHTLNCITYSNNVLMVRNLASKLLGGDVVAILQVFSKIGRRKVPYWSNLTKELCLGRRATKVRTAQSKFEPL